MTERDAWIALASTPGVGDLTFSRLLELHGSATEAIAALARSNPKRGDRDLAVKLQMRLRTGLARSIRESASDPGRTERRMATLGGWVLTALDAGYPAKLYSIEEPPALLYGIGDPAALSAERMVAVVGTRRPTAMGRDLATRIAKRLAEAGATVVSGLALGIDGVAHLSALEADADTVAVVGSGLDTPGPSPHRRLARRIMSTGAVIGELAPGVKPTQGTFPRRNRIISGLAEATIVVEAPARSGALITARHALEQGRALLVAPGRPLDASIVGNLRLLRDSPARPLVGLDEMIVDLGLDRGVEGRPNTNEPEGLSGSGALELLEPTQRVVAQALSAGPQTVDSLCRLTQLDPGVVAASLTMLQLRGWARMMGATHLPAGPLLTLDNDHAA